ncbi:MAG: hypothetical protein NW241_19150 [Bacteroidia bacterium]|nr:hypothetical protein [Bacteroidia bacterium]
MNQTAYFLYLLLQQQPAWLLRSDKIYSVLSILLIIFGLLISYLMFTNKRISELEQKLHELEDLDEG